jgi:hypothetical protein
MCAALLGAGLVPIVSAQTDGSVTFNVQLFQDGGNYKPKHVDTVWVVTSSGTFIKTIWKDGAGWTGTGTSHLTQWQAARGSSTAEDGYSGSTITTYNPMTVTWNCRDAANALMPDGTYKFYVEFTEGNSTGPYSGAISWTKSSSVYSNSYPDQTYIKNMKVVFTPAVIPHDIAVLSITPNAVPTNATSTIRVAVTNKTTTVESFSVVLSNLTTSSLIGTQQVTSAAGNALTNVPFQWSTTNLLGSYLLQATAGPVSNETVVADNTLSASVSVQYIPHDLAVTRLTPTLVPPNTNATMSVTVNNKTTSTETFSVVLSNLTTASLIRTQQVSSLPGNSATNVALSWSTTNLLGNYLLQATAGPVPGESVTDDNCLSATVTVRPMLHDLALLPTIAPALVLPNTTTNTITILATNLGDFAESFGLSLYDDTDVLLIGSNQVSSLPVASSTNLSVTWRTTNSLYGYHSLRAVANPVAGETNLLNNTNIVNAVVANGWTTNTFITKASAWRYNDQGLDLSITPWLVPGYYDSVWSQAPGPLGYSESGQLTNLTTFVSWGPVSTNKYSAYYFRQAFNADALASSLTLNIRSVDGAVLYLNGTELARFNMPAGAVTYTNLAASAVSGTGQYTYLSSNAVPTNMVLGRNVLAAEVHRADVAGSDLAFDMEMLGVVPQFPPTHDVDALALSAAGDALIGDNMPITVTLTNRGNATETVLVLLKNAATGQILSVQTVTDVHPGDSPSVTFNWGTFGASTGTNQLVAYTVVGGVTNLAGAFTNAAVISGSGFATNAVTAAAAIGGRCSALATTGNLLLIGAGAVLEVWDRSNPVAPVKQAALRLPGLIEGITASGPYAFVACGQAGVQFVDLTSPLVPMLSRTFNTSGAAHAVAVGGNYLYVADGVAGLRIVNIVNPTQPYLVGAYYTQGPARTVALSGTRACLLDQEQGLLVLDVSNPAAPALLGAYSGFDAGQALALSGANACIVDGNNHFLVVDISNPAAPALAGPLLLANMVGQAVALNGTTAYVAAGGDGLLVIDASTPSAPVLISTIAMPGEAAAVAIAGSALYVADGFAGFQIFDITSPATPALQANLPTTLRAADVSTLNNLAYVAGGESGLQIFSLTNPLSPTLLGRFTGVTNARAVAVSGTTAYVGDGQYGLKIVSVANPLAPVLLGSYTSTNLGSIRNVGASGSLVVVSDGHTLLLVDASTPASPSLVGTYSSTNFVFSVAVDSGKAYLAAGAGGFIILNAAPGAFSVLGSALTSFPATGVSASGTTAYVGYGTRLWRIYDVSNPAFPAIIKSSSAQGPVLDIAAAGTNVALVTATNMAVFMDAGVPLTPVQMRSVGPVVRAVRVAATPSLALVAEDDAGLTVFANTDDLNHDGIPDSWEQQIVAVSSATNGPIRTIYDVRPNDDFDGDGVSNYAEYLAGTSPIDSHSVFMMSVQPSTNSSVFNINWFSVAGKTYTIYKSSDLKAGFTVFKGNIAGTPPLNTEADSTTNRAAFYIIGVQ